jgi:tRNA(Ile)-lysidine synthase
VNLPEAIRAVIDRHNLIPEGSRVVVGVSGGADSVALVRAFHALGFLCTVAHLNHGLRGAASDEDERFVHKLAEELGFPMVGKTVDVRQLAEESGQSIEMAARQARHDFFAEFGNATIALAHHADDQAETFILKLARGAGTEGLGGMSYSQHIGSIQLIRPMLNVPRAEIVLWLKEHGSVWREDASNSDEAFLRNRVRHTILPMLGNELNPNIRDTILRTMEILREENAWMESLLPGTDPNDLSSLPLAARRRTLRNWLFEQGAESVDFDAVEKILSQIDAGKGTTVFELNDRQRVVIEYGTPRFEQNDMNPADPTWRLTVERGTGWQKDHGNGAGILPAAASFSACKVGDSPIEMRTFEPGDRMAPFGMDGSRKLQDIFTDQKIPKSRRNRIPVVVCRGEIIWLPGYRIARGWEVPNGDGEAVHVRIEQNSTD